MPIPTRKSQFQMKFFQFKPENFHFKRNLSISISKSHIQVKFLSSPTRKSEVQKIFFPISKRKSIFQMKSYQFQRDNLNSKRNFANFKWSFYKLSMKNFNLKRKFNTILLISTKKFKFQKKILPISMRKSQVQIKFFQLQRELLNFNWNFNKKILFSNILWLLGKICKKICMSCWACLKVFWKFHYFSWKYRKTDT